MLILGERGCLIWGKKDDAVPGGLLLRGAAQLREGG